MANNIPQAAQSAPSAEVRAFTFHLPSGITFNVRAVVINSEPWFIAADVCKALGIQRTDDGMSRLDADEKGAVSIRTPGGEQQMTGINESGLYSLILGSRKPEAKAFKKWVTADVLPSLRKTGSYTMPAPVTPALPDFSDPAAAARAWADEVDAKRKLAAEKDVAEKALALAAPKVAALDRITTSAENLTLTETAKVLGVKRATMTQKMNALGWIYRQNRSWVAYEKHIKSGRLTYKEAAYTDESTGAECARAYCHVTPKGLTDLAQMFAGGAA
jgi:prophage antirepressor-like protein